MKVGNFQEHAAGTNRIQPLRLTSNYSIPITFPHRRTVSYAEFSQFLHDFHDEYATVGFRAKDPDQRGRPESSAL